MVTAESLQPEWRRTPASAEYFTKERCHILELSNTADDPHVSVARARVEPGISTAAHRVHGTVERYVVLQGEGIATVEGMAPVRVQVGDVVVIPAGASQFVHNTGAEDLIFLCVCTPRFEWDNYEAV